MPQASKKELMKHAKPYDKECGHWEGKYWCDCKVRGYRKWLELRLRGPRDLKPVWDDDE